MKLQLTLLIALAVTVTVFASFTIPYNNSQPPSLALPAAYEQAAIALGSATNDFHCVSANITTFSSPEGEWLFTFYSTNSKPKFVVVEFNGKIHVENIMAH